MALSIGIVGLPNVGKSTLFNALSGASVLAANYPFATKDPNVGVVPVPDARLQKLAAIYQPKKIIPTSLEFVDIAGLVRGASKGEGLGNQFLGNIREVTAVAHVLRCFEDENITHVEGGIDPARDAEVVNTELCIKDLETVEKRRERTQKNSKAPGKAGEEAKAELLVLEKMAVALNEARPVRAMGLSEDEALIIRELQLLTSKPVLYVANVAEGQLATADTDKNVAAARALATKEKAGLVVICAGLEAEIQQLPESERPGFLESAGLAEPGLNRLVGEGYKLLGLVTYFTCGEQEVRAWTIQRGWSAPQAAGVIHTDFERGFIKAEVQAYDDITRLGSEAAVKTAGLLRMEGKEYLVKDGDLMHFRFNV
jgi:GTP-binding protein YchF